MHIQPRKVVQTEREIVLLYEANGNTRQILLDGRALPKDAQATFAGRFFDERAFWGIVMDQSDLKNAVSAKRSTGGGYVTHYLGRHRTKRVVKAIIVSAIPSLPLETGANPREFRQKCGMAI